MKYFALALYALLLVCLSSMLQSTDASALSARQKELFNMGLGDYFDIDLVGGGDCGGNMDASNGVAQGELPPNAKTIWNFLKSKNLSDALAAGIMGNWWAESSMDPTSGNGAYIGLAQWGAERLTALKTQHPNDWETLDGQLDFFWNGEFGTNPTGWGMEKQIADNIADFADVGRFKASDGQAVAGKTLSQLEASNASVEQFTLAFLDTYECGVWTSACPPQMFMEAWGAQGDETRGRMDYARRVFQEFAGGDNCAPTNFVATAISLAWPDNSHSNSIKPEWEAARVSLGLPATLSEAQDCSKFVATAVQYSKLDDTFPAAGTYNQQPYMANSSAYSLINNTGSTSDLQPGDILVWMTGDGSGTNGHILIYTGYINSSAYNIVEASLNAFTGKYGYYVPSIHEKFTIFRHKGGA